MVYWKASLPHKLLAYIKWLYLLTLSLASRQIARYATTILIQHLAPADKWRAIGLWPITISAFRAEHELLHKIELFVGSLNKLPSGLIGLWFHSCFWMLYWDSYKWSVMAGYWIRIQISTPGNIQVYVILKFYNYNDRYPV